MRIILFTTVFAICSPLHAFTTGGVWKDWNFSEKSGYVIAVSELTYRLTTSSEKEIVILTCITNSAFTNKDLVNIVDIGYQDLANYRLPAFAVLRRGVEKTCKSYLDE